MMGDVQGSIIYDYQQLDANNKPYDGAKRVVAYHYTTPPTPEIASFDTDEFFVDPREFTIVVMYHFIKEDTNDGTLSGTWQISQGGSGGIIGAIGCNPRGERNWLADMIVQARTLIDKEG